MGKEILKLGSIVCSIESDISYRSSKNEEKDFTLALEKPKLNEKTVVSAFDNGWKSYRLPGSDVVIKANEVGAEIVSLCDGKNTIETIAYAIADKFDVEEDDDEFLEQVKTFLNIFKTFKLI